MILKIINKHLLLAAMLLLSCIVHAQDKSVYPLNLTGLDNSQISMANFKGKKIIITVFDAASPDRSQLLALDSLYQKNKNTLVVIAVPVTDLSAKPVQDSVLKKQVADTMKLSFLVVNASKAQKVNGSTQNPLLAWVTNKDQNLHFDVDINKVGELFILNENGKLFARFKEKIAVGGKLMSRLLGFQLNDIKDK